MEKLQIHCLKDPTRSLGQKHPGIQLLILAENHKAPYKRPLTSADLEVFINLVFIYHHHQLQKTTPK
jgi:hypothetical protein